MTDEVNGRPELRFVRVFEAPRTLVFRCMTEPEHLVHFWGRKGVTAPLEEIKVDLRPGGLFETVMVNDADGSRYATRAVYLEVAEPERLAWKELQTGMTVTITFVPLGDDRTEVSIHQANVPEAFLDDSAQAGFLTSLDRFAAYLATVYPSRGDF